MIGGVVYFSQILFSTPSMPSTPPHQKVLLKCFIDNREKYKELPEFVSCFLCGKPTKFQMRKDKQINNEVTFYRNGRLWKVGKYPFNHNRPIKIHCPHCKQIYYLDHVHGIKWYHDHQTGEQKQLFNIGGFRYGKNTN